MYAIKSRRRSDECSSANTSMRRLLHPEKYNGPIMQSRSSRWAQKCLRHLASNVLYFLFQVLRSGEVSSIGTSGRACTTYAVGSLYRASAIFIYRVRLGKLIKKLFLNRLQSKDVNLTENKCETCLRCPTTVINLLEVRAELLEPFPLSCVWFLLMKVPRCRG